MKIVLVHDWLTRLGGAERVLIAFHKIFPEAAIYTLFYDKKFVSQYLPKAEIIPSFLQRIPGIQKFHPWFKILMPLAVESLNFSSSDLIISSSHEFSHGILAKQNSKRLCFYHSPSRILWDRAHEYAQDFKERGRGSLKISLIKLGQHFLRLWDYGAGQRPDMVIANSNHVAERIKKYYGREAKVVYPPVDINLKFKIEKFNENLKFKIENYFLMVSQLYPHKNIDLAVKAFKLLNYLNLIVIGEGPEEKRLKRLIGENKNIKLLGFVPDEELSYYYQNCLAYLIINEEDFGISPLEAMSFGKPVLAYKKGGAKETVLEGITGKFFYPVKSAGGGAAEQQFNGVNKPEPESLSETIQIFIEEIKSGKYKPEKIIKHSEKFSFERFKKEILDLIKDFHYY